MSKVILNDGTERNFTITLTELCNLLGYNKPPMYRWDYIEYSDFKKAVAIKLKLDVNNIKSASL